MQQSFSSFKARGAILNIPALCFSSAQCSPFEQSEWRAHALLISRARVSPLTLSSCALVTSLQRFQPFCPSLFKKRSRSLLFLSVQLCTLVLQRHLRFVRPEGKGKKGRVGCLDDNWTVFSRDGPRQRGLWQQQSKKRSLWKTKTSPPSEQCPTTNPWQSRPSWGQRPDPPDSRRHGQHSDSSLVPKNAGLVGRVTIFRLEQTFVQCWDFSVFKTKIRWIRPKCLEARVSSTSTASLPDFSKVSHTDSTCRWM